MSVTATASVAWLRRVIDALALDGLIDGASRDALDDELDRLEGARDATTTTSFPRCPHCGTELVLTIHSGTLIPAPPDRRNR